MNKIKTGDEVIILAGKDKNRRGRVMRIDLEKQRVLVEGVNMVKKHVRPNPQKNQTGGIEDREAMLHISNVALYNGETKKGARVGIKTLADGTRVRYFKDNNEVIDV